MGKLFAMLAAISYAANTTLSRLAYDTGTDPLSLTLYRYAMVAVIMVGVMLLLRKSWRFSVSPLLFIGCVFGMFFISIGHLGAVNYIPVSLAAIVFYTYPLLVVFYRRWVNGKSGSRFETAGFLLAFLGLVIALGPQFSDMDWRGLAMAFSGAIGALVFMICYESLPSQTDPFAATVWITLGTLVLGAVILLFGFELTPPKQTIGWAYLWLIAVLTMIAFISVLFAINQAGAGTAALFLNLEPVIIVLLAWLVLHEALSITRLLGVFLVVASLFISQIGTSNSPKKHATNKPT